MREYLDIVQCIVDNGEWRDDRTGTGTLGMFGGSFSHDLNNGFPLMTHKRMGIKSIAGELIWFMAGQTDLQSIESLKSTIWREWADETGDLGPIYGAQWRGRRGAPVDQLAQVLYDLTHNPYSRRHLVVAWNPEVLPVHGKLPHEQPALNKQALAPCHYAFQFYASTCKDLYLKVITRSNDILLGLPYNIASYALMLHIVSKMLGYRPRTLEISLGDAHIYKDHIESGGLDELLSRPIHQLPTYICSDYFELHEPPHQRSVEYYSNKLDELFLANQQETLSQIVGGLSNYVCEDPIKLNVSV